MTARYEFNDAETANYAIVNMCGVAEGVPIGILRLADSADVGDRRAKRPAASLTPSSIIATTAR